MKNKSLSTCLLALLATTTLVHVEPLHAEPLPRAIRMDPPVKPELATRYKLEGKVHVEFTIDDAGKVEHAAVTRSSGSDLLDDAALEAVMAYEFEPPRYEKGAARPIHKKILEFGAADAAPKPGQTAQNATGNYSEPKLRRTAPTKYPDTARANFLEGATYLALQIDAQGKLTDTKVTKSSSYPILDDAARETVKNYEFSPAVRDGNNVAAQKELRIDFKLRRDESEEAAVARANESKICGDRINDPKLHAMGAELFALSLPTAQAQQMMEGLEKQLDKQFATYLKQGVKDRSKEERQEIIDTKNKLLARARNDLSLANLEPRFIQAYCDTYTDEELAALLAFMKSPLAASIQRKADQLEMRIGEETRGVVEALTRYRYDVLLKAGLDPDVN